MNPSPRRGSTPILVFAGITGLSVVFFFLFSAGGWRRPAPADAPLPSPALPAPGTPQPAVTESSPPTPGTPPAAPTPARPAETSYRSPDALFREFAARLTAGDMDRAFALAAPSVPPAAASRLRQLLTTGGWRITPDAPWRDAGIIAGTHRRELALEPAAPENPPPAVSVMADAARTPGGPWRITAVYCDPPTASPPGKDAAPAIPGDALQTARRFFRHILSHDFKSARALTDETKVTHEKLAGLCIVFEEGEYRIAPSSPVVVTAVNEHSAWAIVKIDSARDYPDCETGLEMKRGPGGEWRIAAIDFNRMLESYVQASGADKIFYSPIVKSAKGGESIVVYFEFDTAALHPRALHQLDIIASLLKSDPARRMRITGHTDALGSDDYNQRLSSSRAENVRTRLLELGVSSTQIETTGFGASAPLDPNRREDGTDNPGGRSRNRRTEIYLDF